MLYTLHRPPQTRLNPQNWQKSLPLYSNPSAHPHPPPYTTNKAESPVRSGSDSLSERGKVEFLLPCPQQTNKKGCCSSNTSGSGNQGWAEYPLETWTGPGLEGGLWLSGPSTPLGNGLKLCSSQNSKGGTKYSGKASRFLHREAGCPSGGKGEPLDGGGSVCQRLPISAQLRHPGPDAHFLGIPVGFPYSTRVASTLPPILLHPSASCSLVYPVCRKSHIPQT